MTRYGQVIKLKEEHAEKYIYLHGHPWPEVNAMIKACNLANYSIFYKHGFLFAYYEYTGVDFKADMAKMAADPITQKWWAEVMPCQEPLDNLAPGEWWSTMEEVFYLA